MLCYIVLYCVILCYIVLCCVILCYIVLYYVMFCYIVLYCVIFCYIVLCCVIILVFAIVQNRSVLRLFGGNLFWGQVVAQTETHSHNLSLIGVIF
jgi:hypothetical protein